MKKLGTSPSHLLVLSLLAVACSGASDGGEGDGRTAVFLAFAEDFRGYHSWNSFDVTANAAEVGITDGSQLTAYMKALPPHDSHEFPVGTIIVKEATGGTEAHEIFAMVKRGGGFNVTLPGWEWFELKALDDGRDGVLTAWRGVGPPAGETYGGDPNVGCNKCHAGCPDGVCAPELSLDNF
jgi:hypothetical protein